MPAAVLGVVLHNPLPSQLGRIVLAASNMQSASNTQPAPPDSQPQLAAISSREFYDWLAESDVSLAVTTYQAGKIAWHENDGVGNFTEHLLPTPSNQIAHGVTAAGIDGDGDIDIVATSSQNDAKLAWFENDGAENFTRRPLASTTLDRVYSVVAVDVDGDGDVDFLSGSSGSSKVAWHENNGAESFTERVVSTNISGGKDFLAADVDGDGDVDFLSASNYDDKIAWYENDGNQNFTQRVISTNANNALAAAAADLDGDGDLDVLSASRFDDKVAWYENDGNQNFTERVISTKTHDAASLVVADLDNDGDLDVVASGDRSNGTSGGVVWFENDGAENFSQRLPSNGTTHQTRFNFARVRSCPRSQSNSPHGSPRFPA